MPFATDDISTYVVPLDAMSLADAFAFTDNTRGVWRLSYKPNDLVIVSEDDLPVLEVTEEIAGGCVVRIGPVVNTHTGLADILDGRPVETMKAIEAACDRAEQLVLALGGHLASRSRGRWRPSSAADRQAWGAHLVRWNAQKMRAEAMSIGAASAQKSAKINIHAALQDA